jgi:hypothetical protein
VVSPVRVWVSPCKKPPAIRRFLGFFVFEVLIAATRGDRIRVSSPGRLPIGCQVGAMKLRLGAPAKRLLRAERPDAAGARGGVPARARFGSRVHASRGRGRRGQRSPTARGSRAVEPGGRRMGSLERDATWRSPAPGEALLGGDRHSDALLAFG